MLRKDFCRFNRVDPLAEQFAAYNPYHYVHNNLIIMIDPDGMSAEHTIVTKKEDGTYSVSGGDPLDGDRGVYLDDGNGGKGEQIGESLTAFSFFSNDLKPIIGATIDLESREGQNQLDELMSHNPSVLTYMDNAKGNEPYDYKTECMDYSASKDEQRRYKYRGSKLDNGLIVSARDVGNYGAGWESGKTGIPWGAHRLAADALETKQNTGNYLGLRVQVIGSIRSLLFITTHSWHKEGPATVAAQAEGYLEGRKRLQALWKVE